MARKSAAKEISGVTEINPLVAEIQRLKEENEALRSKAHKEIKFKVSDKGALSMYGVRRFPITFYKEEWETILDRGSEIRKLLVANKDKLTSKSDK